LNVITPDYGQLSVMARSVRKEKSRLAGGIELFAVCDIVLHEGRGEVATLTGAKMKVFYDKIMTDYSRMQFAYEAIKQISTASKMVNEPEFYELLRDCLEALNNTAINLRIIETWFYLHLAKLLGNELNILTDSSGMKLVEDAQYNFDVNDQVFTFAENGRYGSSHIKLLRVIANNPSHIIARVIGVDEIIDDCYRLAQIVAKI
jgi:DNA repair protein RecO (recombination protein O)